MAGRKKYLSLYLSLALSFGLAVNFVFAPKVSAAEEGVACGYPPGFRDTSPRLLLDEKGKVVKELEYQFVGNFSEGLALVRPKSKLGLPVAEMAFGDEGMGYIDTSGNLVIPCKYKRASEFSEGLASVSTTEKNKAYIDKKGNEVIKLKEDWVCGDFSEGLATVLIETDAMISRVYDPSDLEAQWGFIDKTGKLVIPTKFSYANAFSDGVACVRDKEGKWFLIDKTGMQIGKSYDDVGLSCDGMAYIQTGKKFGFETNTGAVVVEPCFDEVNKFAEGLCAVRQGDKVGFIDKTGKKVTPLQFKDARFFSNGLCPVKTETGKWGYIDTTGKMALEAVYDNAWTFTCGLAAVQKDDKLGYVDKSGKFVIEPKYDGGYRFADNRAVVNDTDEETRKSWRAMEARIAEKSKEIDSVPSEIKSKFSDLISEKGSTSTVSSLVSPNGAYKVKYEKMLFSRDGGAHEKMRIYKSNDNTKIAEFYSDPQEKTQATGRISNNFPDYSWSCDSKTFAYIATRDITFLNVETGNKTYWKSPLIQFPSAIRYSPDGNYIVIAGGSTDNIWQAPQYFVVLDAKSMKEVFKQEIYTRPELSWSADARYLAVACGPECLKIFDVANKFKISSVFTGNSFRAPLFSPDGKYLAILRNGLEKLVILNLNGKELSSYPVSTGLDYVWSKDGKKISYCGFSQLHGNEETKSVDINLEILAKNNCATPTGSPAIEMTPIVVKSETALPRFGYLDSDGKSLIPNDYFSITESKCGTIIAGEFDIKNPKISPASVKLFSKDGSSIKFDLSDDYVATGIEKDLILIQKNPKKFPEMAGVKLFGLCNLKGEVILEPKFVSIWNGGFDYLVTNDSDGMTSTYDYSGKKLADIGKSLYFIQESVDPANKNILTFQMSGMGQYKRVYYDIYGKELKAPPQSENSFLNNAFPVSHYGKVGFLQSGRLVMENDNLFAKPGKNGLHPIMDKNMKWGVIDKTSNYVIPSTYEKIVQIADELFAASTVVGIGNKVKWQLLDSTGKVKLTFPDSTNSVGRISENLIPYWIKVREEPEFDDSKYRAGFISTDGKVVIEPKFFEVEPFKDGKAVVTVDYQKGQKKVGVIDKSGAFVLKPDYSDIKIAGSGNFIAAKLPEYHFSTADWKSRTPGHRTERAEDISALLRDYDLIGMEKKKLFDLLGTPGDKTFEELKDKKEVSYTTTQTGCVNEHIWIVFEFENDKVKRWAFVQGVFHNEKWKPKWIEDNVVYSAINEDENRKLGDPDDGPIAYPKYPK